jgi:hypothetical protein
MSRADFDSHRRPPFKEIAVSDTLTAALLGNDPAAFRPDVSLDAPLTLPRIVGRDLVVNALTAYGDLFRGEGVLGGPEPTLRVHGDEVEGAVFTTTVEGHTVQIIGLVTHDDAGLIATIHMYGRPWPYMALLRERLAKVDQALTNPDLGTTPYVAEGPGTTSIDAPPVPPFAENISFHSPLLTAVATGKYANERILTAASQIYGEQHFRAVLQVEGQPAIAAVFDGVVEGNVLQLVAIFTVNDKSELEEIRIFSRPWPVTAYFRKGMYGLLNSILGPEFWQGPDPQAPLPIR